ncbi:DUF2922 domain-containing protein [Lacticaseibacillus casei]|jgi:ABC-type Na+ efflux pump permease subunit|uniref:DUF2922 domain-containing protein n=4 Tax=Lacticaseibacillus TaxID=2759736 RepID=A0A5R8LQH7_LACZE|nr:MULTISPECIES: DUF2922 domain-containing protein [Lacticaseibacillus]OFR98738.1 small conserved protein [Lactobacillus sp. HMSC068F07]KLI76195.1 small conserved protein [Lacticaseibacillus casei]KRK13064.1 hypothetical protein FD51_GL002225 [Lacticaseibacillus zeae DSM 20178 = KCTC 3804]MDE3316921.1 DUF2922 domain-containing protein [Lacticaseibacillus zeae]MDG3061790.1 DUF2922 domain-containing protein [Lacticaseibacillus sp. BCRC 81376]
MKTLIFSFKSEAGKATSIRINKYDAEITADQAQQFADAVAQAQAFKKEGMNLYATPVSAKVTETNSTDLFTTEKKPA